MQEPEILGGRATPEGTRRFAARFPQTKQHFRCPDRLSLSSIGLGTRQGSPGGSDDLFYRSIVPRALGAAVNVFDTALSYRMQTSERCLGAALRRAIAEKIASRDEIFVISKAGYLTPDPERAHSPSEARRDLIETYVGPGLIDPALLVDGNHSLEPAFLLDQIQRSRKNLGLETIDLYCLQDPELHLLEEGPTEFRSRLRKAFAALEEAVSLGWIGAYGISTWSGLLVPHLEKGHVSLADTFELALEVGGGDHHLRAVQLPYGLALGDAQETASQFGGEGFAAALPALRETGTAIFVAVPLMRGRAVRGLPGWVRAALPDLRSDAQRALQFARSTPTVTSALVGMRRPEHLDENLELAEREPASPEAIESLFERVRQEAS